MYAERKIIDQVRECLQRLVHVESPEIRDLAEQYAALCRTTRSRLEMCAGYLARGLRTESKHVAETSPPLLDLVRILLMQDLEEWHEFCLSYGLPEPPSVPADLAEMLETAFGEQRKDGHLLDTLMQRYRKAALIGNTRQKVDSLRKIRAADPNNPN